MFIGFWLLGAGWAFAAPYDGPPDEQQPTKVDVAADCDTSGLRSLNPAAVRVAESERPVRAPVAEAVGVCRA